MSGLVIPNTSILGDQGVALTRKIVLDMGYVWTESGKVEAGIDGEIEIRNPQTGEMTNQVIRVQVKAVRDRFQSESNDQLSFTFDQDHIDYWQSGNVPVIVVVCRPSTGDAYWAHVREYFADPQHRTTRTIRFDKRKDMFCADAAPRLSQLAAGRNMGLYASPPPKHEVLLSNLFPVSRLPRAVFIGQSKFKYPTEIFQTLRLGGVHDDEFLLRGGNIYSVYDLRQQPWSNVGDFVEELRFEDCFPIHDRDRLYEGIDLLKRCLKSKLWLVGMRYSRQQDVYYFSPKATEKRIRLKTWAQKLRRSVFTPYRDKREPGRIAYCSHMAIEAEFRVFDGNWFLEVNPSYYFTQDGRAVHPYADKLMSGIRRLERHESLSRQLRFWSDILTEQGDLFTGDYEHLRVERPLAFDVSRGISDASWKAQEDTDDPEDNPEDANLFELLP